MRLYVATGYATRHRVHEFMAKLRERVPRAALTCDWTALGDPHGRGQALRVADLERAGIDACNAFVALLPGGFGTASEIGYALGMRMGCWIGEGTEPRVILVGAERGVAPAPPGWLAAPLYEFAEHCATEAEAIELLADPRAEVGP